MFPRNRKQPHVSLPLGYTRDGKPFVLTGQEFTKHKHIMGISGSGKSYFLAVIALLLLKQNISICLLDPHGDLATLVVKLLAAGGYFDSPNGFKKLYYVDFKRAETDAAIAFNVLHQPYNPHTIANNLLESMHRAFPASGTTANLDNVLLASSLALIENNRPITDLGSLILDVDFRKNILKNVTDPLVLQFFTSKFAEKASSQLIDSTMRRLFLLIFSPVLRNTLGQQENKLNFRQLMDNQVSCIFNLGGLDDQTKRLLGCLVMVGLEHAFLSRADLPPEKRHPFHIIADEFQLFIANSEVSFSRFLEECRKYSGVLYCAHQHLQQLPKGIAGALQNAISLLMKTGYLDSSYLAGAFYRKDAEDEGNLFTQLFFPKQPDAFSDIENISQARKQFETLERQEALVTINGVTTHIKTHTIPPIAVPDWKLKQIEDSYAKALLTPLSEIHAPRPSAVEIVSAPLTRAQRRAPRSSASPVPFQTFVGAAGTDEQVQALFSLYGGYLTVSLVAKILNKSENTARNKLKKLVPHVLEQQSVPRTSPSGKTPTVFSLKKAARKHEFLEHRLATATLLVNTALLPTVARDYTLLEIQADDNLKASPLNLKGHLLVPDGIVRLVSQNYEYAVYFELDRNTEFQKEKIVAKLNNYKTLASQCDCMVVAFCCVEGGDLRVKTLKQWTADVVPVELRELFLFAAVDLDTLTPETLFLSPIWSSVGETILQTLLDR